MRCTAPRNLQGAAAIDMITNILITYVGSIFVYSPHQLIQQAEAEFLPIVLRTWLPVDVAKIGDQAPLDCREDRRRVGPEVE